MTPWPEVPTITATSTDSLPASALIIAAAGEGRRFGGAVRKPWLDLCGRPILLRTLEIFRDIEAIVKRIIVIHPEDEAMVRGELSGQLEAVGVTDIVCGGQRRQDSVMAALERVPEDIKLVLIQDAVRPFTPRRAIIDSMAEAVRTGAALVAVAARDTIKRADAAQRVAETLDRATLWLAQTPQVFRREVIVRAYEQAQTRGIEATDDAQLVEQLGQPVALVPGSYSNIKITTPEDLRIAELLCRRDGGRAGSP